MHKKNSNKPIYLEHSSLKYPLPKNLYVELSEELHYMNQYPSGGDYRELSKKLADYVEVAPENILPTNGSDEVIESVTRAFGHQLILIPAPTFSQYEASADRNGFNKKLVNCLQGMNYKLSYRDKDLKKASLVWICNPNNPTGESISRKMIQNILDRSAGIVVVDECNYEYLGETVVDLIDQYPNLVISRSFSKNFGLAGFRLGFAIASPTNIKQVARYCQHFRVNRMAEIAGIKVLKYLNNYQEIWREVAKIREWFIHGLHQINVMAFPSKSNFVLVDFSFPEKTKSIWQYLREQGVYTFAAWEDEFSGLDHHYIRFTIGTRQEMEYTLMLLSRYQKNNPF